MWTTVTAIIFVGLAIQGNRIWAKYILTPVPADAVTIEVTAQQFAWNIRYAGPDGKFGRTDPTLIDDANGQLPGSRSEGCRRATTTFVTQNIMAIPVNRPVRVMLRTKDVTHSFFVPQPAREAGCRARHEHPGSFHRHQDRRV